MQRLHLQLSWLTTVCLCGLEGNVTTNLPLSNSLQVQTEAKFTNFRGMKMGLNKKKLYRAFQEHVTNGIQNPVTCA